MKKRRRATGERSRPFSSTWTASFATAKSLREWPPSMCSLRWGVSVTTEDFVPFTGTGEANFLGGVASVKEVSGFDPEKAKKRFFEIYLDKYAEPNSGIGFPGALEFTMQSKNSGLKVAVASSADRVKVDANLAAAACPYPLLMQLSEPSGIIEAGSGRFLVADTNNSVIRCLDLNEEEPVLSTLELKGVQPPSSKPNSLQRLRRRLSAGTKMITANGGSFPEGYLYLAISVPDGYRFSKEVQSKFDVEVDPTEAVNIEPSNGVINSEVSTSLHFKRTSSSPATGRINCKGLLLQRG